MSWRLAKSLTMLLKEANAVAPGRSRAYDGTIGDAAHAARASRHNPNGAGVVTALDITHDPAHGMDTYALYDYLRAHPHPNLEYVISNRRVARRSRGWISETYGGSNAHDHHIHVAVGRGTDAAPIPPYDDTDPWGLAQWKEGDNMTEEDRKLLTEIRDGIDSLVLYAKRGRLSDVARSHDAGILKTMVVGDFAAADELEDTKSASLERERKALGL